MGGLHWKRGAALQRQEQLQRLGHFMAGGEGEEGGEGNLNKPDYGLRGLIPRPHFHWSDREVKGSDV